MGSNPTAATIQKYPPPDTGGSRPTHPETKMRCVKKGHYWAVANTAGQIVSTHTSIWAAKAAAHARGDGHQVMHRFDNQWMTSNQALVIATQDLINELRHTNG